MQVSKVSYLQVKNLGNYEKKEAMTEVVLTEGDCGEKAMTVAMSLVAKTLGVKGPTVAKTTVVEPVKVVTPEVVVEDTPKKKVTKKKVTKKEVKVVTKEEVLAALRSYAEAKDSKEMAMAVIEDVTGTKKLADVDVKLYGKLVKALSI